MPRRRRRAAAAVLEERGLLLRVFLYSPKDMIAGLLAFAACSAVIANALFLQRGPHPAPMFSSIVVPAASPPNYLPRARPTEADPAEPKLAEPKFAEARSSEPKAADSMTSLVKSTTGGPLSAMPMAPPPQPPTYATRLPAPIPPAPIPITGARRVAAVQRALTEYGYGQLRPTGMIGADTRAAIQKFESERKLPATGQVTDRLIQELGKMIGHTIE
jgi:hypothetical protein